MMGELPWVFIIGFGAVSAIYIEILYLTKPKAYSRKRIRIIQFVICPPVGLLFLVRWWWVKTFKTHENSDVSPAVRRMTDGFKEEGRWIEFYPTGVSNTAFVRRAMDTAYPPPLSHEDNHPWHEPHILDTRTNVIVRVGGDVEVMDHEGVLTTPEKQLIKDSWQRTKRQRGEKVRNELRKTFERLF